MNETPKIRVLIVDDHPIVRLGLSRLLEHEGFLVSEAVGTVEDALLSVARTHPDLVITDISLGPEDGLGLVRQLSKEQPDLPVLVYSMFEDAAHIERALGNGAKGYITKAETNEVLPEAARLCLAGGHYLSPIAKQVWDDAGQARKGLAALSLQERQVYDLLGQGFSTSAIAARIDLSPRTVETYYARIQVKLGLSRMTELRCMASTRPI
jgi:DNA-binding NarL/FixJ family response regulator